MVTTVPSLVWQVAVAPARALEADSIGTVSASVPRATPKESCFMGGFL
jgi:hypothetical protein